MPVSEHVPPSYCSIGTELQLATSANLEQVNQEADVAHVNLEAVHSTGMAQVNLETEHTLSTMAQVNLEAEHFTSMVQVNLDVEHTTIVIQMTSLSSRGASSQNPMLTQPEAATSVGQPTTCTSSSLIDPTPGGDTIQRVLQPDKGLKITLDSFDLYLVVHHMTEQHQHKDRHCVTVMSTENRVSGAHLRQNEPIGDISTLENGKCVPNQAEHRKQEEN